MRLEHLLSGEEVLRRSSTPSASEGQVSQRERLFLIQIITEERQAEKTKKTSHPVRTLLYVHNFRSVKIITIFDILQAKANLSKVSGSII